MKVLVIGANGQFGTALCRYLAKEGREFVPLTHGDIEITDMVSVKSAFFKHNPDVVINTAAFVKVDDCEVNPDKAYLVNAIGSRNLAAIAQKQGTKLVHISSDYVFGGEEHRTVPYTEFDPPSPVNVFGKTKVAGENYIRHLCPRHFIVRVSGLFGLRGQSAKGPNFVETMLRLAKEQKELRVVNDQIFSPTYGSDAARKVTELITTDYYGIFHITNKGYCSWYEFTTWILKLAGLSTPVIAITSDKYPQKAKRPGFSVLDNYHLRLLGMDDLRPWQEALEDYMRCKGHI